MNAGAMHACLLRRLSSCRCSIVIDRTVTACDRRIDISKEPDAATVELSPTVYAHMCNEGMRVLQYVYMNEWSIENTSLTYGIILNIHLPVSSEGSIAN